MPLERALRAVVDRTKLDLIFEPVMVAGKRSFCKASEATVEEILHCVLRGTGLVEKQLPSGTYILAHEVQPVPSASTERTAGSIVIRGKIVDSQTQEGLPAASIFLAESTWGAYSREDGTYEIRGVTPGVFTLAASMIGYQPFSKELRLTDSKPVYIDITLTPAVYQVQEFVVTAAKDKNWSKRYDTFQKEFIGTSPLARETRILNPYVLAFKWNPARVTLSATASQPLEIENRALGYHITFYLGEFVRGERFEGVRPRYTSYQGHPFFRELVPRDSAEAQRWRENRIRAFRGSSEHLIASLVRGTAEQEGFELPLAQEKMIQVCDDNPNPVLALDGQISFVRRNSAGQRSRLETSTIQCAEEPCEVFPDGYVAPTYALQVNGAMGKRRLADLLPRNYAKVYFEREVAVNVGDFDEKPEDTTRTKPRVQEDESAPTYLFSIPKVKDDQTDSEKHYREAVRLMEKVQTFPPSLDWNKAQEHFEILLKRDSLYRDALVQYSALLRLRNRYKESVDRSEAFVRLVATHQPDSLQKMATGQQGLHDAYRFYINWRGAKKAASELAERTTPFGKYFHAEALRRAGDLDQAEALLLSMMEDTAAPHPTVLLSLAALYFEKQDSLKAQQAADRAVVDIRTPGDARLVFNWYRYILNPEELDQYESLQTIEEYRAFFRALWEKRDPMPASAANVRLAEHFRRLRVAQKDYLYLGPRLWYTDPQKSYGTVLGSGDVSMTARDVYQFSQTYENYFDKFPRTYALSSEFDDRGIVYLRYGEPDDYLFYTGFGNPTSENSAQVLGTNASWRYRHPELIDVHFAHGNSGWRLTPIQQGVDPLHDLRMWGSVYDPQNSPDRRRRYLNESMWNAYSTDRLTWERMPKTFEFPYMMSAFRGANGKTRIEVHYSLPTDELAVRADTAIVEVGCALHDSRWRRIQEYSGKLKQARRRPVSDPINGACVMEAPADSYHVSIHARPPGKDMVGIQNFAYRAPVFADTTLLISDLMPAYFIDRESQQPNRGAYEVYPAAAARYSRAEPVYFYYELYNLKPAANGLTLYEVEYTLTPIQTLVEKVLRQVDPALTIRAQQSGSETVTGEAAIIDASTVPVGRYVFRVRITEPRTGRITEAQREIELVE